MLREIRLQHVALFRSDRRAPSHHLVHRARPAGQRQLLRRDDVGFVTADAALVQHLEARARRQLHPITLEHAWRGPRQLHPTTLENAWRGPRQLHPTTLENAWRGPRLLRGCRRGCQRDENSRGFHLTSIRTESYWFHR